MSKDKHTQKEKDILYGAAYQTLTNPGADKKKIAKHERFKKSTVKNKEKMILSTIKGFDRKQRESILNPNTEDEKFFYNINQDIGRKWQKRSFYMELPIKH